MSMKYRNIIFFSNFKLSTIIIFLLSVMPIIESLNGKYYGHHISDLYRLATMVLIIFYLIRTILMSKFDIHMFNGVNVVFILIVLTFMQYILFHGQSLILFNDLKTTIRIIICPLYYVFFLAAMNRGEIERRTLIKLLYLYTILYIIMLIIPRYLGIGYVTYDLQNNSLLSSSDGIGFKGFFIETNSLVAILIGCMVLIGEYLLEILEMVRLELKKVLVHLILLVSCYFSLILVSMKTGIVVAMLYILILLMRVLISKRVSKKIKMMVSILTLILGLFFSPTISNSINELITRSNYFLRLFNNDIVRFLTSSRSVYFEDSLHSASKSQDFFSLSLFGGGYYVDFIKPYDIFKRRLIEMDFFDFYFAYGYVGVAVYFGYFMKNIINIIFSKMSGIKLMILIFGVYGFFAGHVLFNSMTATFLAICFAYYKDIDMGLSIRI